MLLRGKICLLSVNKSHTKVACQTRLLQNPSDKKQFSPGVLLPSLVTKVALAWPVRGGRGRESNG